MKTYKNFYAAFAVILVVLNSFKSRLFYYSDLMLSRHALRVRTRKSTKKSPINDADS